MADSKYSDACYLADYIDVFAKKNAKRNSKGFKGFKAISVDPDAGGGAHEIIARLTSRNGRNIFI